MRIPIDDIKTFSLCPRYFRYSKNSISTKSKKLSIINKVIRKAYIRKAEYSRHSQWKSVIGWMDKEVYKNADIDNEESFQAAHKLAEDILVFIQKWYQFDYLRDEYPTYIDLPVSYDFGSDVVYGEIPIVQIVGNKPIVKYIDELEYDNLRIYNDIKIMGWASMLLEMLDIEEVGVRHIFVGPKSGISSEPATVKKNLCPRIKETIREIATSIRVDISYPSYTEMCYTCPFKRQCSI